eukprot:1529919-Alexandrium_andersonii.AAC.1
MLPARGASGGRGRRTAAAGRLRVASASVPARRRPMGGARPGARPCLRVAPRAPGRAVSRG